MCFDFIGKFCYTHTHKALVAMFTLEISICNLVLQSIKDCMWWNPLSYTIQDCAVKLWPLNIWVSYFIENYFQIYLTKIQNRISSYCVNVHFCANTNDWLQILNIQTRALFNIFCRPGPLTKYRLLPENLPIYENLIEINTMKRIMNNSN